MAVNTSDLDALISKLRRVRSFVVAAAPAAAEAMAVALRETAAAGESPDGSTWPDRKRGGRALANAAAKITVRAIGTVLLARIGFPEALHNSGTPRLPQRQILPSGAMPTRVSQAIKQSIVASWEAAR